MIGSVQSSDLSTGRHVIPRPDIHLDDGVAFTPCTSASSIDIFFGTGSYAFDKLMVFAEISCQIPLHVNNLFVKEGYTTGNFAFLEYQVSGLFGSVQTA